MTASMIRPIRLAMVIAGVVCAACAQPDSDRMAAETGPGMVPRVQPTAGAPAEVLASPHPVPSALPVVPLPPPEGLPTMPPPDAKPKFQPKADVPGAESASLRAPGLEKRGPDDSQVAVG